MVGRPKIKVAKDVGIEVVLGEDKPTIGEVSSIAISVKAKQEVFLKYVLFELINERTDKRAPMDRITSRSRYLYRFNIDQKTNGDTGKYEFKVRIPVHKEPSRNDKFICIKWQLGSQLIFQTSEENKELLRTLAPVTELEVV